MIRSILCASLLAASALTSVAAYAGTTGPKPMFAVIPKLLPNVHTDAKSSFPPSWTYTYKSGGSTYNETFIGANPSSATSTTVPVYIIPLKMVYGSTTEDPSVAMSNGNTPVQQTVASPMFQNYPFKFGKKKDKTQFADAFQKVNVWNIGGSAAGYHVILGQPTITAEQTLTVPKNQGGTLTAFGVKVIGANINWFDPQIEQLIGSLKIPANALPIFLTTQTYLLGSASTSDCCIGGYHSVNTNGQPYSHFTYIQSTGAFSQDVSALSHEISEWLDDPYTNNNSPCGIYEVGDPLERNANYGDFAFKLGGFTYHLQDEALLPYFGDTSGATLNKMDTLEGEKLSACQNGS